MKYNLARHLRVMGSFFMGFIAGIGFAGTIIPFALALILGESSPIVLVVANRWMPHIGLVWGVAAAALTWFGGARIGLLLLGLCGIATGAFLAGESGEWTAAYTLAGMFAGLLYGGGGGLLLGRVFDRRGA